MSALLFKVIVIVLLTFFSVWSLKRNPDKLFWIALMFFFDPGGFFLGYLDGTIFWRIKYYDLFFILMFIAYYQVRSHYGKIALSPEAKIALRFIIPITLFVILIYGFLIPFTKGYEDPAFFLQKNRQFFYAPLIFIFIYYFSTRSIQIFYRYLVWLAIIILGAYFITLLTSINLIPVLNWDRYSENDRISMISYGLIFWVQPLGLVILTLGNKVRVYQRKVLYLSMILMVSTIILTLTRREFMRIFYMLLIIPFMVAYISRSSFFLKFRKYIISALLLLLFVFVLFPNYVNYSDRLVGDVFSLFTTGADNQGVEDYRVSGSGDLLFVKKIIVENLGWGIGYYPATWTEVVEMKRSGSTFAMALDASSEVPIYGAIMRLGIIGLIIPIMFYFYMLRTFARSIQFMKSSINELFIYPIELSIIITLLYFYVTKFTLEAYGLFGEFYSSQGFVFFCMSLGMFLGILKRMQNNLLINIQPDGIVQSELK